MATIKQIIADVKKVLPIANTNIYDDQLTIFVNGAVSKLKNEGVGNVFTYQTPQYYDYITCIRYQVAMDFDLDVDIEKLQMQYLARVNTLRCISSQAQT